jgi:hypothetical protein
MSGTADSDYYGFYEAGDAIQQTNHVWHRALVEPSSSSTFPHQSPALLPWVDPRLPRYCYRPNFGRGTSDETEFTFQDGFMQASMPRSQRESPTMPLCDLYINSLDLHDQSATGSTIWPGTSPPNYVDNNHIPLQGVGDGIYPTNFAQVIAANSSGGMLNLVSGPSCQRSESLPMLFRSERHHVRKRLFHPVLS